MTNSSDTSSIIIANDCSSDFDPYLEISIYIGTVFYLGAGLFLHFSILKTIYFTKKVEYKGNSFFQIFAMDSVFSIVIIIAEILFNRLFIYIPPLCPIISPWFWTPSLLLKLVYATINYGRFAKSVAQIVMVLNRMSCVLIPTRHKNAWKVITPTSCILISILPMCGIWNVLISRVYPQDHRGGFTINYIKVVPWAALSLFQSIFTLTALSFTVICTSITLYKLIFLPSRIKSAEKSLCVTSIFISITFLSFASIQVLFYTCSTCDLHLLVTLQSFAFDAVTVGTAAILILTNSQMRRYVFNLDLKKDSRVFTVSIQLNTI